MQLPPSTVLALTLASLLGVADGDCAFDEKGHSFCKSLKLTACSSPRHRQICNATCLWHLDPESYRQHACVRINSSEAMQRATLTELGRKYGTDKVAHGFTDIYGALLDRDRGQVQRVLEVGVYYGASLTMWRDYFQNANVVGVDFFEGLSAHTFSAPPGHWPRPSSRGDD